MAPPDNTSFNGSIAAENSMNSISIGFEKIDYKEVNKPLRALELLLSKTQTYMLKTSLYKCHEMAV
ncbi:hypothetical protein EJB00_03995 [Wolbachia endosymbiont of Drosophila mauritiana]|uniref:hypothetical protein n=1 Tax=unclassified Wolbachia TaxID=2640676 RepID=UPI0003A8FCF0|nr:MULTISPECIES: hypothetical protein [unclassified Wolbachia]QCB62743.1 hypothetical protein EJA99_04010 [Wolbachia endosymbiont of Drosophila mauritiana]QCB63788.1 hypothetical protein EJB00_03995 [Wolbachia endosymbiont of Drosophila mauritiana]TGB07869.1 hypothetical protein E5C28_00210 [Wolbachia endosymbiont of Drosophila mauritiana]